MRNKLQKLTIRDHFMFGAVMMEPDNCRRLLELVLGISIKEIVVDLEKTLVYRPEYRGVRLDVLANDGNDTRYNVELQVKDERALPLRSRYYHSQIDMELLTSGLDYSKLPGAYVIFICDFDPFGLKKYCYTFLNRCEEDSTLRLEDGSVTMFLSTRGENGDEVPEGLIRFLEFIHDDSPGRTVAYEDGFVTQLQNTMTRIKASREMGERYMLLEELLKDERAEGRAEGRTEGKREGQHLTIIKLLEDLGELPQWLRECIHAQKEEETLVQLTKVAARADSLEAFVRLSRIDK